MTSSIVLFNDLFELEFAQIAILATVLVTAMCGLLSPLIVYKQRSYIAETVTHLVFPGVVVGYLLPQFYNIPLWLGIFLGASVTAFLGSYFVDFFVKTLKIPSDAAGVVTLTGFFAVGVQVLAQRRGMGINIERFLLGDVLTLGWGDVVVLCIIASIVTISLLFFRRHWNAWVADPEFAKVAGYKVAHLERLFPACITLAVLGGLFTVGGLMIAALMTLPGVIARPRSILSLSSIAVSLLLGIIGITFAFQFNLPVGPTIVVLGFGVLTVKSFVVLVDNPR